MFDFSSLEVKQDATIWVDLPELSPGARVQCLHAGESNAAFYNAMLAMSASRARLVGKNLSAEDIEAIRKDDRVLFGDHVVIGWENIQNTDQEPVEFTRELAKEFCQKLPRRIFDKIRHQAGRAEEFTAEAVSRASVAALAKN